MHWVRRAASRADWTAGRSSATKITNDGDHHQELHERKAALYLVGSWNLPRSENEGRRDNAIFYRMASDSQARKRHYFVGKTTHFETWREFDSVLIATKVYGDSKFVSKHGFGLQSKVGCLGTV